MSTEATKILDINVDDIKHRSKLEHFDDQKETASPFIRSIPGDWELMRVRSLTSNHKQGYYTTEDYVDNGVKLARITDIDDFGNVSFTEMPFVPISEADENAFRIEDGDFLFARSGTIGRFGLARNCERSVFASYLIRFRFKKVAPDYMRFALQSPEFQEGLRSCLHGGANQNVHAENIKEQVIAVPREESEQRAIASFLDVETSKIDTLVKKKERLIELLQEKRTALISHAVTKGLNPAAPLKNSGVDWLGQIPEHWNVLKLARVTLDRCDGPFGSGLKSQHYTDEGVRVIRLQNIRHSVFDDRDAAFISPEYYRELGDHDVHENDLLIAGLGDENNSVGRACVAPASIVPAMVKADCFRFRLDRKRANPFFVAYQLSSTARDLAGAFSSGTTRLRMNLTVTSSRVMAMPPLEEQAEIVAQVDAELAKLDALIAKVTHAIERLREYRTALISAAVTGKIDVRVKVPTVQPVRKPNKHFCRTVLAAEIIDQMLDSPQFGWIKLQKNIILAERHLQLDQIQSEPKRDAAGPFDNAMMRSVHSQLEKQKWCKPIRLGSRGYRYERLENHGNHCKYFDNYWGDRCDEFNALMALLKPLNREQSEIVATLYMAWNDFLIRGEEVTDDRLVHEAMHKWHSAKQKISEDKWRKAIDWIRQKKLVPTGYGSETKGTNVERDKL